MIKLPARILFLGAPGAGKGTFASRISTQWTIPHISTGDIMRAEVNTGSKLGNEVEGYTSKGQLVPDAVVNNVVKQRLNQDDVKAKGYLLDGFPRTIDQAVALSTFAPPHLCLNVTMPDEILVTKIAGRRLCKNCGHNYNVADIRSGQYLMPPLLPKIKDRCDKCKQLVRLYQRDDDKEEVVKERLRIYNESTAPLINFYQTMGILVPFEVYRGVDDLPSIFNLLLSHLNDERNGAGGDA